MTQDVQVRCSVIASDHNAKLVGHFQNWVGRYLMTACYFQHCTLGVWLIKFLIPQLSKFYRFPCYTEQLDHKGIHCIFVTSWLVS